MSNVSVKVLSHGGGVQTRALLHMILDGLFEKPDYIIFADTQAEPQAIYDGVMHDKKLAEAQGIPLEIVTKGNLSAGTDEWGGIWVPAFTVSDETGKQGMLRRQCTQDFKIRPIRKRLRQLGAAKHNPAELWLGISTDEITRVKPSDIQRVKHRWPLIEMNKSRDDCVEYLRSKGITPVKSACVFCPYHSARGWEEIRKNEKDWEAAVEYDKKIRDARPDHGPCFVHRSRVPLSEAPVSNPDEQPDLFDNECSGHCGL